MSNPRLPQANGPDSLIAYDRLADGLQPGKYSVLVMQVITHDGRRQGTDAAAKIEHVEELECELQVVAPLLRLPSNDEVRACYPPRGATTELANEVPYLLLQRRSLPWERPISGHPGAPWLALLLLSRAEMDTDARLVTMRGGDFAAAPAVGAAARPMQEHAPAEDLRAEIVVLELSGALFYALCPRGAELAALAHVREVPLRDKADAGTTGSYALVMANRRPKPGVNTAVLVSLAGAEAWVDGRSLPERLQLAVLHSWTFECVQGRASFAHRIQDLKADVLRLGHRPRMSGPLKNALDRGCVPLAHQPETGIRRVALYRGPLLPVCPLRRDPDAAAWQTPPVVTALDSDVPELSYGTAWHLGRLLTLGESRVAAALLRWGRIQASARRPLSSAAMIDAIGDQIEGQSSTEPARAGDGPLGDALAIATWLGRLALLVPVPLRYILPSGGMLPPSSLRGFHVDPGWTLDSLLAGAVSLTAPRLAAPDACSQGAFRHALSRLFQRHRDMLSRHAATAKAEALAAVPRTQDLRGWLLRSTLLAEYPGVEITLHHGAARVQPVRFDRLSEDILLVMAYGDVDRMAIREPREGLRFVWNDNGSLSGSATRAATNPGGTMRGGAIAGDVLDVGKLAAALLCGGTVAPSAPPWRGTVYAEHWMQRPADFELSTETP